MKVDEHESSRVGQSTDNSRQQRRLGPSVEEYGETVSGYE